MIKSFQGMRTVVLLLLLVTFATGLTVQETVSQDKTNAQAGFMDALKKCKNYLNANIGNNNGTLV